MENQNEKKKHHWFAKFTLGSFIFAFLPMLILLVSSPILFIMGCKGGASFHCKNPAFNSFAENVTGLGAWGNFLTVPLAFVVWVLVLIFGLIPELVKKSKESKAKI